MSIKLNMINYHLTAVEHTKKPMGNFQSIYALHIGQLAVTFLQCIIHFL